MGLIGRLKQKAGERFAGAEKTEIDPKLTSLISIGEVTEKQVKEILSRLEVYLVPDQRICAGEFFKEGLDVRQGNFSTYLDQLARTMGTAAEAMGRRNPFARGLARASAVELDVGDLEHDFVQRSARGLVLPLKRFLANDMKNMNREQKEVHRKRLDLDAAKTKLRKARSGDAQAYAELDVRAKQDMFEQQCETALSLYERLPAIHVEQLACLKQFIEAQVAFYSCAQQELTALLKEL